VGPIGKALWFVESHFADDLTLDEIAAIGGVSRHHMVRAFAVATGLPVIRYLRGRRLSEAARSLANGAPDILAVALEAGYGSHEAFTRAFRDQFGVTPEQVRAQRHTDNLLLVEPIKMDQTLIANLEPPRFETSRPLLIVGLGQRYSCESSAAIPAQWQRFLPHFGNIPGQVGRTAYGVRCNSDDAGNFDYIAGVEVGDFSDLPEGFSRLRLARQRYAVFTYRDHISTVRRTVNAIWSKWLPESGHEVADAPDFERYGESFDPSSGMGGLEIWIPLKG
jgi:AraC family transcriptional regulator